MSEFNEDPKDAWRRSVGLPTLRQMFDREDCPNCGERGFDMGEGVPSVVGWMGIPGTCRNCGYMIEKRRFMSSER